MCRCIHVDVSLDQVQDCACSAQNSLILIHEASILLSNLVSVQFHIELIDGLGINDVARQTVPVIKIWSLNMLYV